MRRGQEPRAPPECPGLSAHREPCSPSPARCHETKARLGLGARGLDHRRPGREGLSLSAFTNSGPEMQLHTAFRDVKAKCKWLSVNTVPTAPRMSQSPGTPTINPAAPVAGSPASYPLGRTELPRCPRLRRSKVDRHREELNFQPLSQATYRSAFPEDRLLAPPAPSETIRPQSPLTVDPLDNSQRHLIRRLLSEQLPSQWPSGTLSCAQRMLMASSL